VRSSAKFDGEVFVKGDHTDKVSVLLTKKCSCTHLLRLLDRHIPLLVKLDVFPHLGVHDSLYLSDLFLSHLSEVRKIKAEQLVINQRATLLNVIPQYGFQGRLKQVRRCMVIHTQLSALAINL